jgi:prepilin-type N-terminal cleavage/methylation domain-containing protein
MKKNFREGFTLIELLIVIALLGALAVGLLAALDPFEQLKKGTDTGVRNTVSEFHGAVIRYYAIKTTYPWCDDDGTNCAPLTSAQLGSDPSLQSSLVKIVAAGELKSDFDIIAGTATLNKIYVTFDKTNNIVTVCYQPTAKSFQADPNTKFKAEGTNGTNCKSQTGGTVNCFWCVR